MVNNISRNFEDAKMSELTGMGVFKSIFYFAIPALILVLSYHIFRPWLLLNKFSDLEAFLISLGLPMIVIFLTALFFYGLIEKRPFKIREFSFRMRYPRIHWKDFAWGIAIFILGFLGFGLMREDKFREDGN
jgi:membrane protease YdiL (CAAX protease family)